MTARRTRPAAVTTTTTATTTATARGMDIVLTAGRPDLALWGVIRVTSGYRVVQRSRVTDRFHTVSLPWATLEQAQVDMHARTGH